MKKIYQLTMLLFICVAASAQVKSNFKPHAFSRPAAMQHGSNGHARTSSYQLWLEYDSADSYTFGEPLSNIIYPFNHYYRSPADANTWQRCIVAFDSLYDLNTTESYDHSTVTHIVIDSIYTFLGHE